MKTLSLVVWCVVMVLWCVVSVSGYSHNPIQYHIQTDKGPDRYFRFQTYNGQYRKEKRLDDGTVFGTYGWVDAAGYLRLYDYVADSQGYRIVRQRVLKVGKPAPPPKTTPRPPPTTPRPPPTTPRPLPTTRQTISFPVTQAPLPQVITSNTISEAQQVGSSAQSQSQAQSQSSAQSGGAGGFGSRRPLRPRPRPRPRPKQPVHAHAAATQTGVSQGESGGGGKNLSVSAADLPAGGTFTINYDLGNQFHFEKTYADGTKVGKHGYVDPLGILRITHYNTGADGRLNQRQVSGWVGARHPAL